jgi:hypothetical protein
LGVEGVADRIVGEGWILVEEVLHIQPDLRSSAFFCASPIVIDLRIPGERFIDVAGGRADRVMIIVDIDRRQPGAISIWMVAV